MGGSDLALGVVATMFKENPALDSSTGCKNTFCSGLLQLEKKDLRAGLNSRYSKGKWEFTAKEQGRVRGWKTTNLGYSDLTGFLPKASRGDQTSPGGGG